MNLNLYRPADASPTAVKVALLAAQSDVGGIQTRIDEAKTARDVALLDGTPKELPRLEDELTRARADGERLEAIVGQLGAR